MTLPDRPEPVLVIESDGKNGFPNRLEDGFFGNNFDLSETTGLLEKPTVAASNAESKSKFVCGKINGVSAGRLGLPFGDPLGATDELEE